MVTTPRVLYHLLSDVHITTTQTPTSQLQNPARSLSPIIQRTDTYFTKPFLPLIIHNAHGINLINSTRHPVKTHHNSHPSLDKQIFAVPCPHGANLTNPPWQNGVNLKNPWMYIFTAS